MDNLLSLLRYELWLCKRAMLASRPSIWHEFLAAIGACAAGWAFGGIAGAVLGGLITILCCFLVHLAAEPWRAMQEAERQLAEAREAALEVRREADQHAAKERRFMQVVRSQVFKAALDAGTMADACEQQRGTALHPRSSILRVPEKRRIEDWQANVRRLAAILGTYPHFASELTSRAGAAVSRYESGLRSYTEWKQLRVDLERCKEWLLFIHRELEPPDLADVPSAAASALMPCS